MQESTGELQQGVDGESKGGGFILISSPAPRMPCKGAAIPGYRAEQPARVGGTDAVTVTSWRPTPCHLAHC